MTALATPTLFDVGPPAHFRNLPLEERFRLFVAHNSEMVARIERLALSEARNGARRLSAKLLVEKMRATEVVHSLRGDHWKVDNSFTAPLARYLIERNPELLGLFETRKSVVDREVGR